MFWFCHIRTGEFCRPGKSDVNVRGLFFMIRSGLIQGSLPWILLAPGKSAPAQLHYMK